MDKPFDPAELRPTRPPGPTPPPHWRVGKTPVEHSVLQQQTRALLSHPYDPSPWIARAETLSLLDFPELAVGDAYKAVRLCKSMLEFVSSRSDERWSLGSNRGFWMREDNDSEDTGRQDKIDKLRTSLSDLWIDARGIQASNMDYHHNREGKYIPQAYPWLEEKHRVRGQDVLDEIARAIGTNKAQTPDGTPCVEVKRCSFQPGEEDLSESAPLGVFATCDLPSGYRILIDRTEFFGCSGPGPGNSKNVLGGSFGCLHPLHPNLADDESSHDLRWVRERAGQYAADPVLLCRTLLASAVSTTSQSPLDLPEIARLTPTYHRQNQKTFYLSTDIEVPNEALQQFGIDIFANHHYDTWVIFTLAARLRNNSWSSPVAAALNPLFSLFNHSCEPTVEWETRKDHRTIDLRLSRDVVAGEQLFVEYDGFMHSSPLEARRERLSKWIDGPCLCTRCVREEELAAALASVHAAAASEKRKFHQKLSVVACGHDDDDDDEIANRVSLSLGILVFLWTCL
jgi:hypothetical protein